MWDGVRALRKKNASFLERLWSLYLQRAKSQSATERVAIAKEGLRAYLFVALSKLGDIRSGKEELYRELSQAVTVALVSYITAFEAS